MLSIANAHRPLLPLSQLRLLRTDVKPFYPASIWPSVDDHRQRDALHQKPSVRVEPASQPLRTLTEKEPEPIQIRLPALQQRRGADRSPRSNPRQLRRIEERRARRARTSLSATPRAPRGAMPDKPAHTLEAIPRYHYPCRARYRSRR